jgi:hypothetical protein
LVCATIRSKFIKREHAEVAALGKIPAEQPLVFSFVRWQDKYGSAKYT